MDTEVKFKKIYLAGAIATVIVIILTLLDIFAGSILGGDLSMIPQSAAAKFIQLHDNKLLGLYNLDLLNLTVSLIMIPTFTALFLTLKSDNASLALLTLIIFSIGTAVFIANNAALPMLELSQKYNAATTNDQRAVFASAGEALTAKGAHGSFGVFSGFILITLSEILISLIMLKGVVFSKTTAYFGLSGTSLLFIYLILVTFVPSVKDYAMIIAAPGGILSLIWMNMFTRRLFQLAR